MEPMENRDLEPETIFNGYGILKCFHAGSQVCPFGADILLLCNHGALLYCQYGLDQPIIAFLVAAPASPGGTSLNASPNPTPDRCGPVRHARECTGPQYARLEQVSM